MRYPIAIEKLMRLLNKLPGVGRRTAERYAFDFLLQWKEDELVDMQSLLQEIKANINKCDVCGSLTDADACHFCSDSTRRRDLLCIVGSCREVYAIESTKEFRGMYHVLSALLSPLDGRGEEVLELSKITNRILSSEITEVIIALDSTLEGDTTSLFLKQHLEQFPVKVSRLAFGIPVGSALEYVDGGTLARAFSGRATF